MNVILLFWWKTISREREREREEEWGGKEGRDEYVDRGSGLNGEKRNRRDKHYYCYIFSSNTACQRSC